MSVDGRKRTNIRVTHRLSGDDFANVLCLRHVEDGCDGEEELPAYSRDTILDMVRGQLADKADARNWWRDDVEEDAWGDELWKWADDLVRRRFPELY